MKIHLIAAILFPVIGILVSILLRNNLELLNLFEAHTKSKEEKSLIRTHYNPSLSILNTEKTCIDTTGDVKHNKISNPPTLPLN